MHVNKDHPENVGRSNVPDCLEFMNVSSSFYPNCCSSNSGHFVIFLAISHLLGCLCLLNMIIPVSLYTCVLVYLFTFVLVYLCIFVLVYLYMCILVLVLVYLYTNIIVYVLI